MSRPRLAVAAGFAAAVAFAGSLAIPPAHAAATPTSRAADYILKTAPATQGNDPGADIDEFLALVAAGPDYATQARAVYKIAIQGCDAVDEGASYGTASPARAAKCGLAAETAGDNAKATSYLTPFANRDYSSEYEFGVGLEAVAFIRAGMPLPATLVTRIDQLATPSDPNDINTVPLMQPYGGQFDATAEIFQALVKLPGKTGAEVTAEANLQKYLEHNQNSDGSWTDFSPVNTTGMVAPAIGLANATAASKGKAFVVSEQNADGGFPASLDPDQKASDLRATNQAIFALAGTTLFDLVLPADASATPTAPSTTPTTSATPTPTASPTSTATSTPTSSGTATVLPVANEGACVSAGGVWVIVDNQGTPERRGCVKLTGGASSLDALKALTTAVVTHDTKYGPMICTIDQIGDCSFANQQFWGYYVPGSGNTWTFAQNGPATDQPAPGSSIAFEWGTDANLPAAVTATDIPLPAPVASPTPATSATPTPTSAASASASSVPSPSTAATPGPGLANTGSDLPAAALGLALVSITAGAVLVHTKHERL